MAKTYRLSVNGTLHDVVVDEVDGQLVAGTNGELRPVSFQSLDENTLFRLELDGRRSPVAIRRDGVALDVFVGADRHSVEIQRGRAQGMDRIGPVLEGEIPVTTPMTGQVTEILVAEGDTVAKDDPLIVIVAMKMNNEIRAPAGGTVKSLSVALNDAIDQGTLVLIVDTN